MVSFRCCPLPFKHVSSRSGSAHCIEQLVLALLQLVDGRNHVLAMGRHGVCVCLRLPIVVTSTGSLGNQGTDAQVVGVVSEMGELIVDDAQFVAQGAQARGRLPQSSLDQPFAHPARVYETGHNGRVDDEWGITDGYHDVHGRWHSTTDETRARLRQAMGVPRSGRPMWFVLVGHQHRLWSDCEVVLEDGTSRGVTRHLPADLPIGYHDLVPVDGSASTRLVVHPGTCPKVPRMWGVAAQTYALWSGASWGIGDLFDVRRLAESIVAAGGSALLLSPLHQPAPTLPQEPSPYYPSSRRAWNPLLIGVDAPPPSNLRCGPDRLIDRDDVWIAKRSVLEAEFDAHLEALALAGQTPADPGSVALWNARCDVLRSDWTTWPDDALEDSGGHVEQLYRATFHEWLQTKIETQLADVAATGVTLIGDLAVGFSPLGADAHEYRHLLALDMRIGAPSDEFNPAGQNWGIPPFVPWRVRHALYQPFIDTLRASLRGMGGLRIDHVMGLFRQYWVPQGGSTEEGAYVRFPAAELLAILAIEATRAGAFIVGEDLGTVEPEVHQAMAEYGIAGTKVLWFEDDPPSKWPEHALATITTHDLPTLAMVFARKNLVSQTHGEAAALPPSTDRVLPRLLAVIGDAHDVEQAKAAAHRALLASPSALRLMTSDDLAGAVEQPNLPGTNDHPSWRIPLPRPVTDLL
jgi:4-alpha-glucanotransferase